MPLAAAAVVGATPVFKEPLLRDGRLFWLEQRPAERGRTTLLMRIADGPGIDLTPELDLRSSIHGYGGGVYAIAGDIAVGIAERGRSLWSLDLAAAAATGLAPQARRIAGATKGEGLYGDGLIDRQRHRWIGVQEREGRDQLVAVPLAGGEPEQLRASEGFYGYPVLSPCGRHLAWISWQHPCMPWDRSQLWLSSITEAGTLRSVRAVAGSSPEDAHGVSVFQPLWCGADLVVANDRSGWWNLERLEAAGTRDPAEPLRWHPLLPMQAEFAVPQWVYGMRTTAWDGQRLLAVACREGRWQLGELEPSPSTSPQEPAGPGLLSGPLQWRPIPLPFDDLAGLSAEEGRLVAIASGPSQGAGLLELDLSQEHWSHTPADPRPWECSGFSQPESLWFSGHAGERTQAWFYPPQGGENGPAPLLIRGHSGPTGMARTGLSLSIQFWTSRGWGVVDVNYGGSTGFGRAYRERLDGQWGVVDVDDCLAAALALVTSGRADPQRIAMEGGSAAGFTVLAAMARSDTIRAGAIRYPVTDLAALAQGDHRFEARYCDSLVGPWPQAQALYAERSPRHQVDRLQAPLLVFHGLEDEVIPHAQSRSLVEHLERRGIPVELRLFEGEGHGFRGGAVQLEVLEATEAFFRRHLDLPAPTPAEGKT